MKTLTLLAGVVLVWAPVLPGQTWEVQILPTQGGSANSITSDLLGAYAPGPYVLADANVAPLEIGTKGKPVYISRTTFNFSVRNPAPRTGSSMRFLQFSGIEIDTNHSPASWNDPHACQFPGTGSTFPGCLAEFMNNYDIGQHPGPGYESAGLWLYIRDLNFLAMAIGDEGAKDFTAPTARLDIYSPGDCMYPIQAGIGFLAQTEFPSGVSGTTKVTRKDENTWQVDVNQPVAIMVFLLDRVTARNKTTCQIISSAGIGPIWTKPVRFSMLWKRVY